MATHYEVLGVAQDVTEDDLRKTFRKLARSYHPDSGTGSAEQMGLINAAFDTLKSIESRAAYDLSLASAPEPARESAAEPEPEAWGVEDDDWVDVVPGPRHLAPDTTPPPAVVDPGFEPDGRFALRVLGVLVLALALVCLFLQWNSNFYSASGIRLMIPIVAGAALAQVCKPRLAVKLQGVLVLGMLAGVLSLAGVWPLGPISGAALLALGPAVWMIRMPGRRGERAE